MTRRWIHPWWLHLPAAGALIGYAAYQLARMPAWPKRVPLGYGFDGSPHSWGSPWIPFGLVVGLGLLFLVISFVLDELWARQESRKRFNPLTLLDDLVIGMLIGTQIPLLQTSIGEATSVSFPWRTALACVGGVVLLAAILERARPFAAGPDDVRAVPSEAFRAELEERRMRGERIVYWDIQNPRYVTACSLGVAAILWIGAGVSFAAEWGATVLQAGVGLVLLLFYGGMRTRVTHDDVVIRFGLFGFRVLRCSTDGITSIAVRTFSPLREFGGYGIRFSRTAVGYFLAGRRGVLIEREGKKPVLIGSDNPDRLAEVLSVVSGRPISGPTDKLEEA